MSSYSHISPSNVMSCSFYVFVKIKHGRYYFHIYFSYDSKQKIILNKYLHTK